MKKGFVLGAMLVAALSGAAQAGNYGYAGCGLGAVFWGRSKNRAVQTTAATTNGTFYSQTFGITSGTSECTEGGVARKDKEREIFVAANLKDVSREMAEGRGDFVSALGALSGCGKAMPVFLKSVQTRYKDIVPTEAVGPLDLLKGLDAVIAADSELAGACRA